MNYKALMMQMKLSNNVEERILAEELILNYIRDLEEVVKEAAMQRSDLPVFENARKVINK